MDCIATNRAELDGLWVEMRIQLERMSVEQRKALYDLIEKLMQHKIAAMRTLGTWVSLSVQEAEQQMIDSIGAEAAVEYRSGMR